MRAIRVVEGSKPKRMQERKATNKEGRPCGGELTWACEEEERRSAYASKNDYGSCNATPMTTLGMATSLHSHCGDDCVGCEFRACANQLLVASLHTILQSEKKSRQHSLRPTEPVAEPQTEDFGTQKDRPAPSILSHGLVNAHHSCNTTSAMHSHMRAGTHVALRLPSGLLKIVELTPNTYVA